MLLAKAMEKAGPSTFRRNTFVDGDGESPRIVLAGFRDNKPAQPVHLKYRHNGILSPVAIASATKALGINRHPY